MTSSRRYTNTHKPRHTIIAAIDIGSNALRLRIANVAQANKIKILLSKRESVRLGADTFTRGRISSQSLSAAVKAINNFKKQCQRFKVTKIRAVATSALRSASNRDAFINSIKLKTGIDIEVISGMEEARLIQGAIRSRINLGKKLAVTIDLGGGSAEVCLVKADSVIMSETYPIGTVRLLHLLGGPNNSADDFAGLVREYVHGLWHQLSLHIGKSKIQLCIGTGGNFEALGDLRTTLLGKKFSNRILLPELLTILNRLRSMTVAERITTLKLRPDRADVILPAAEILADIMKVTKTTTTLLPRVGLRDGVILDMIASSDICDNTDLISRSVVFARELAGLYRSDMRHAEAVRAHAVYLFDQLKNIHKLSAKERYILEIAAIVHDIGRFVESEEHHKHSMYIIRATQFPGLDSRSKDIIACVARYHRKSLPKPVHDIFGALPASDKKIVSRLAAILRIADSLDRAPNRIQKVIIQPGRTKVKLLLKGQGKLLLEKWSVARRSDLFVKTFNREIEVH